MIVLSQYEDFPGIYFLEYRIITFYGLMYLISFIVAMYLIKYVDVELEQYKNKIVDYTILGTIIGGRLGYYIFYDCHMTIYEILYIWRGGMSFHGGLIGVLCSIYILSQRYQISVMQIYELLAVLVPIGIFFVRIGNFINQEMVGIVSKYGVIFTNYDNQVRLPVQLFESILEGLVIFVINLKCKNNRISRFLILYAFARILCEFFRAQEETYLTYMTYGQLLTLPMLLLGIALKLKKL